MGAHSVIYDRTSRCTCFAENPCSATRRLAQLADELGGRCWLGARKTPTGGPRGSGGGDERRALYRDLVDGTLVIVRGTAPASCSRALQPACSRACPRSRIVLTGGLYPSPAIRALLARPRSPASGSRADLPGGDRRAFDRADDHRARDEAKIATAVGVFEAGSIPGAGRANRAPRPATKTPIMFQYELLEREGAARHIVLPEGAEERILRAADILLRREVFDMTSSARHRCARKPPRSGCASTAPGSSIR